MSWILDSLFILPGELLFAMGSAQGVSSCLCCPVHQLSANTYSPAVRCHPAPSTG
nr:MAG TPA: hypothetical protein [Caudoviricetes sp.]